MQDFPVPASTISLIAVSAIWHKYPEYLSLQMKQLVTVVGHTNDWGDCSKYMGVSKNSWNDCLLTGRRQARLINYTRYSTANLNLVRFPVPYTFDVINLHLERFFHPWSLLLSLWYLYCIFPTPLLSYFHWLERLVMRHYMTVVITFELGDLCNPWDSLFCRAIAE